MHTILVSLCVFLGQTRSDVYALKIHLHVLVPVGCGGVWVGDSPLPAPTRSSGFRRTEMFVFSVKLLSAAIIQGFIQKLKHMLGVTVKIIHAMFGPNAMGTGMGMGIQCGLPYSAAPESSFCSLGPLSVHPLLSVTVHGLNLFLWHRVLRSTCFQQTGGKSETAAPLFHSFLCSSPFEVHFSFSFAVNWNWSIAQRCVYAMLYSWYPVVCCAVRAANLELK